MNHDPKASQVLLAAHLKENHEPCPVCGYDLFGSAGPTCPECGSPVFLGVVSPHARLGPWLLGVVSFALALGFDAVGFVLGLIPSIIFGPPAPSAAPEYWRTMTGLLALAILSSALLLVVLRSRRWWQSHPPRSQWKLGIYVFLGVGLTHAAVGTLLILLGI